MKRIITVLIVSSVSCPVFAGAYVETREAYNTASELHEVILRAGYNFDMGAGLMFTNAYNVGKWDELCRAAKFFALVCDAFCTG